MPEAVVTVLVAADAPILLILLFSAVTSACATFNSPAARAVVPEIVSEKDLATANALFGLVENLVVVVGPAIGGLLLLTGEPTTAMAFNALTFLFSAALVTGLQVRSRGDAGAQGESLLAQIKTGLSALRAEPVALALVLFCALDSAVYGASTVLYVPAVRRRGRGTCGRWPPAPTSARSACCGAFHGPRPSARPSRAHSGRSPRTTSGRRWRPPRSARRC